MSCFFTYYSSLSTIKLSKNLLVLHNTRQSHNIYFQINQELDVVNNGLYHFYIDIIKDMKFLYLVIAIFLIGLGFYYLSGVSKTEPVVIIDTEGTLQTRTIERADYSFEAPLDWIDSEIDFEGCVWNSISNPSDGHRMSGEIAIYPSSCFDLTNAVGYSEFTEKDSHYIVAYYDKSSGITDEEVVATKQAYQIVIDTFLISEKF